METEEMTERSETERNGLTVLKKDREKEGERSEREGK